MRKETSEWKRLATIAKIVAMEVRNAMEGFHARHLTDEQMQELNPIIRNAIYSALVLLHCAGDNSDVKKNQNAIAGVSRLLRMVPKYWELSELNEDTEWTLQSTTGSEIPEAERKRLADFCRDHLGMGNSTGQQKSRPTMTRAKSKSPFLGLWHIVAMEAWDEDYFNEEVQAFIEFEPSGTGHFQFGYVQGYMDQREATRDGKPAVEWSWEGMDGADGTPLTGRGWAVLEGDELHGRIVIHLGDESGFEAQRADKPRPKSKKPKSKKPKR